MFLIIYVYLLTFCMFCREIDSRFKGTAFFIPFLNTFNNYQTRQFIILLPENTIEYKNVKHRIMKANCLKLILLLLVGLCPASMIYGAQGGVFLYTPYTKISVPPGQTINYSVEVHNNTSAVQNAAINVVGLPKGWTYSLKADSWSITQLSVLPKDQKSFTLTVDVPLKVNKGVYHFSVVAAGLAQMHLTVIISEQGTYQTAFSTDQPNMEGNSKASFTFNANLKNQTDAQQLYSLTSEYQRGWSVIFRVNAKETTSAQVEPNGTQSVTIEINPPANVKAGKYKIPVHAATSTTSASLDLEVVITGTYDVELTTPEGLLSTDITAGSTKKMNLLVKNTGTSDLSGISLKANAPADWEVTFDPAKVNVLAAGSSTTVVATMKASRKAIPGDYITKMTASAPEATSTAEFRVTVKTSILWGWLGILIIAAVLGGVYYLFRKYGRR